MDILVMSEIGLKDSLASDEDVSASIEHLRRPPQTHHSLLILAIPFILIAISVGLVAVVTILGCRKRAQTSTDDAASSVEALATVASG